MKKLNNTSKPKVPTQDQIHAMKYLQVLKRLANEYAEKKSTQKLNDNRDPGKSPPPQKNQKRPKYLGTNKMNLCRIGADQNLADFDTYNPLIDWKE